MSNSAPSSNWNNSVLVAILIAIAGGAVPLLVDDGPTTIVQVLLMLTVLASVFVSWKWRKDGRPWRRHAAWGVVATIISFAVPAMLAAEGQPAVEKLSNSNPTNSRSPTASTSPSPSTLPSPTATPFIAVAATEVTIAEHDSASIFEGALRVGVNRLENLSTHIVLATSTKECGGHPDVGESLVVPGGDQVWYRVSLLNLELIKTRASARLRVEQYAMRPASGAECY